MQTPEVKKKNYNVDDMHDTRGCEFLDNFLGIR